ncbi:MULTISPECIES: branched-chain amino acid ABC transporter permease [Ralstonia solanacearum species complex]|uniref:Branched-chain amino acid ABC transporter permease n=4 Tax=Ralstonia solanacearum species complex TaxID=3116862 RepID=A0AAD0S6M0_RALSL|nr:MULTISPECIES: branched-chain amino acid ABC transporter permease [Ralstonia solanacearum species complex]CCA80719.1 putative Branched-chain amino acid transport system permease, membrane component (livM) [blood disease bacterium R229]BEU70544.1 branched-chain amino acid ABC transporter permease [Ralstonia pseudosolanacearum]AMP36106.1 ABC transporter permease [Ralstonia solanacearum]AQW30201.1 branched-chain amino acid ABC transporter permease [blood disease bacterium A2-HR MARDI]AXV75591.1
MNHSSSFKFILYGLLLVALIAAPLAGAYPVFVAKLLCFVLFASAFNLLLGYTGLLSFGHAAFFGGAGYVAGYLMRDLHLTPELGLIAGTAAGALIGLVVGLLAIRRQGIYFAMITLALAQMFYFFCLQAPFTGGEDGLQGVPRGKLLGVLDLSSDLTLYYVVLAIVAAAFLLIVRTIHSPFGQILKAIKENEPRAISLGYDTDRFKLLAFVLSAALSGLAGALKTLVLGFETLTDVHWAMSGSVILMTLVGGLGILSGPILGAALVIALENKLGDIGTFLAGATGVDGFNVLGESVTTVTGAIFVICVLTFRRGIMGEIAARVPWLKR